MTNRFLRFILSSLRPDCLYYRCTSNSSKDIHQIGISLCMTTVATPLVLCLLRDTIRTNRILISTNPKGCMRLLRRVGTTSNSSSSLIEA